MSESTDKGAVECTASTPSPEFDSSVDALAKILDESTSPNNYELVPYCKDSCTYCLGRGQERWLSARHTYSDGSVDEEFELRVCRRARYHIVPKDKGDN